MNHDSSVDTRTDLSLITEATVCEIENKKINSDGFFDQSNKRFRDGTFQNSENQENSQLHTAHETSIPATSTVLGKPIHGQEIPVNNNTYKTRDQLLKLLDCMVLAFNVADFDILAKTLSESFASDATVKIRLFPKETNHYFQTNMSLENFTSTGISSVLLLWMLLHKTHPDGVMQIIDKRICYRQILHKPWVSAPAITAVPSNYKESDGAAGVPSSSPTATTVPPHTSPTVAAGPVSIIETVIKFTGYCITLHSIHELYCVLAEEGLALLTPQTPTGPESSTCTPPTTAAAKQLRPEVFSEYISAFLAHELLSASSISAGTAGDQTGGNGWEGSLFTAATSPKQHQQSKQIQHRDCGYLIDIVQIFNNHGLVVDFTFNVLSAESTH